MIPCGFKSFFGFDCPTCGIQRSANHLINGDIFESFFYFPALLLFLLAFIILGYNKLFLKNSPKFYDLASKIGSTAAFIQIGYYFLRMIQILPSLDSL
jgi:hypothetical protein